MTPRLSWRTAALAAAPVAIAASFAAGKFSSSAPASAAAPRGSVRAAIARTIAEETTDLRDEAALDAYLALLRQRAERRGQVTALEVEPGVAAIERLSGALGPRQAREKQRQFTEGMAELSARLRGGASGPQKEKTP